MISKETWNKYFCICLNSDIISNIPERAKIARNLWHYIIFEKSAQQGRSRAAENK